MGAIEDGYVDEETLLEETERDVEVLATQRSTVPFPSTAPDGRSWTETFASYRQARESGASDVPPVVRWVKRLSWPESGAERFLGGAPRKVLSRVRDAGWEVELRWSLVGVGTEFYAADSQKKPGQEQPDHSKGDLKKPAHEVRNWWIRASFKPARVGFIAHWVEGVTSTGRRGYKFDGAHCVDPVGMPVEFFHDYAPSASELKPVKNEPRAVADERILRTKFTAEERDRSYNDGQSWLNRRPYFPSSKDFEAWLSEAIALGNKINQQLDERNAA